MARVSIDRGGVSSAMVNSFKLCLAVATVGAVGLAGCTLPPPQPVSTSISATTTVGSLEPVYNPPPGTPFRCIGAGNVILLYQVPGDPDAPRSPTDSPVATLGNRRGDWLLVVTRAGAIGWIYDPHEESYSQEYPGRWCHVYQDARGRIVFKGDFARGSF
jgi:hypothetical protein